MNGEHGLFNVEESKLVFAKILYCQPMIKAQTEQAKEI